MPRLPRKPGRGVTGAVAATIARRREARAPRVVVRDRESRPRTLETGDDPSAQALLKAAEDLISAAQRRSTA